MQTDFDPPHGVAIELASGLRRIIAPNPTPMTFRGTNTYLLGQKDIAVIDPGPQDQSHLDAILRATGSGRHISHIIVTHSHLDHSPLARTLAEATAAPVHAFGDSFCGRSEIMEELAKTGLKGGGEGVDRNFVPDEIVCDGDILETSEWALEVIHTPGHLGNHICLQWGDRCFTADHVMGWASSMVSPPDGDLTDFMASCERLRAQTWDVFYPGHGEIIANPAERLDWLIKHRHQREKSILEVLKLGPANAGSIAKQVYVDTDAKLLPAAERNVLAHLIDLTRKSTVSPQSTISPTAYFKLSTKTNA